MERDKLEKHVKDALIECQKIISKHPSVVLSEADYERLLCRCISDEIDEVVDQVPEADQFSVHTQISHYIPDNGKYKFGERVDILILDESKLEDCKEHQKEKYFGTSIAFELKFLHIGDSVNCIKYDFEKWKNLRDDSSLYVVVLLEVNSEKAYNRKKEKIDKIENVYSEIKQNGQNQLQCYVMMKKVNNELIWRNT
jgi:tetrahydromethanopterin S-methyltransferase subunit G